MKPENMHNDPLRWGTRNDHGIPPSPWALVKSLLRAIARLMERL